ncbi:MAG: TetR/AcrR family transcriptional regulator [Aeromicrobium erythreum]
MSPPTGESARLVWSACPSPNRRAARTREILEATRALFDERGLRDAQIDDIARSVGINRAIIYRHFSGKEELFALTLVGYLDQLSEAMRDATDPDAGPGEQLAALTRAFMDFGETYPAFVDCALALLRRPGSELMHEVQEEVMVRLGSAINGPLGQLVAVLERGNAEGEFHVEDPVLQANIFYTQALGVLNLARLRLAVREESGRGPRVDDVAFDRVKDNIVSSVVLVARAR